MVDTFTPKNLTGMSMDNRHQRLYNNQFFDYLSDQLPKNHQELFKWCEIVFHNSPSLLNGVRKLVNYPITDFVYKTDSDTVRKATQELVEDILHLRDHLITLGLDYYTYGNVFRSVYFPFTRFLRCAQCGTETNINQAVFKIRREKFVLSCGHCLQTRNAEVEDRHSKDLDDIRLISWNPKRVSLFANPITGHTAYYYSMPPEISAGINASDKTIVAGLPLVFIEAAQRKKTIEFGNNFHHLKSPNISGFASGWGMPPIGSILKLYLYQSVLRKSSEAIALEHITPKTVLYPEARTNDPTITANLNQWRTQMAEAMAQWRQDPNYVMFAPFPTGVLNVGAQGRALIPSQEIRQAEEDMVLGLDIPLEFVYHKGNINPSPIALRLLENQLTPYTRQLKSYCNWIIKAVNARYDKSFCEVDFVPFKLSDDAFRLQIMQNAAGQSISMTSMLEALGLDPTEERERLKSDQKRTMWDQHEVQREAQRMENNIATQTEQEMQAQESGTVSPHNQDRMIAQAQQMAMEMLNVPYEQRRSAFAQLQSEDYVMYALVKAQMDSMKNQSRKEEEAAGGVQ